MAASANCVVAVVDDDNRVLKSLGHLLESAGYAVHLYSSADKLLQRDGGLAELDCLVSDIGIPGVDGFELQRAAKAAKPDYQSYSSPVVTILRNEQASVAIAPTLFCRSLSRVPIC